MNLARDLGYGLRQMGRRPVFSLTIILTLAIGIGPNVAIFSVLKAVALEPLPYSEPERLVQVWETDIAGRWRMPFAYPDFSDIREQAKSFEAFGVQRPRSYNLGTSDPERLRGLEVTADALAVWGVPPARGRLFTEEEVAAGQRLVVLSYDVFERSFGGDPAIVGGSVPIDGESCQVVGIMPPDFEVYTAWTAGQRIDLWTPLRGAEGSSRGRNWLLAVARLKPGVSSRAAEAEMRGIASRLQMEYPETNSRRQVWVSPFQTEVVGGMSGQLLILATAAGFVLLAACANVAGILLARGADRRTELAIRGSLGADRRAVLTQLLTESGLLSLVGGVAGVLLTVWSIHLIKSIIPPEVPRTHGIAVDSGVLVFALLLTMVTGLLSGLTPALIAARADIATTLREGSGTVTATRQRNRTLRWLAVSQIAAAFLLVNAAILLYKSYENVLHAPFAFDTENVITARIALPGERYEAAEPKAAFWARLTERLDGRPGVERSAATTKLPLEGGNNSSILVRGEAYDPEAFRPLVERSYVSPGYFEAMGIPVVAGRVFGEHEGTDTARVVVVNQALVDRYYPGTNPIGEVLREDNAEPEWTATIIGVVASVPQWGPTHVALPEWYAPFRLGPHADSHLVLRSRVAPASLVPMIRAEVREMEKGLPLSEPRTMARVLRQATGRRQFLLRMVGLFAAMAILLAMAGIFGTLSHSVAQRNREIAVRLAFGADRRRILTMVLRQGIALLGVGIGAGMLLVASSAAVIRSQLYGVSPLEPVETGVAILLVALVTLAATMLPALLATRVDPIQALRFE
jgi:putative ABC transport system permease protein